MRTYLPSLFILAIICIPGFAQAQLLAYPEGQPQQLLVGSGTEELNPEAEAYRQSLLQIIKLLQMQLAELVEKQAITVPNSGERISYSTGSTIFENDSVLIEAKQTAVSPYQYDGNNVDDDSMEFAMQLEITNKNTRDHLLIDRESLIIQPVNENRQSITPKRMFNFSTGHTRTTSDYGYDAQDRKMLAIKPGQTSTVLMYHAYQFANPGKYRGMLDDIYYTFDTVKHNAETDQFEKNNRVYRLPEVAELETAAFNRLTIMVESQFINESATDNKYDLAEFNENDVPFTFLYPDTFTIEEDDSVWTISHEDNPYIVVSLDNKDRLPSSAQEVETDVSTLNYERTTKTTYLFSEKDVSGSIHEYQSLTDNDFTLLLYDYSETTKSFTSFDVGDVFVATFVSKR